MTNEFYNGLGTDDLLEKEQISGIADFDRSVTALLQDWTIAIHNQEVSKYAYEFTLDGKDYVVTWEEYNKMFNDYLNSLEDGEDKEFVVSYSLKGDSP